MKKKEVEIERLLQKILTAKGEAKKHLIAILKNKYPDVKVPK